MGFENRVFREILDEKNFVVIKKHTPTTSTRWRASSPSSRWDATMSPDIRLPRFSMPVDLFHWWEPRPH